MLLKPPLPNSSLPFRVDQKGRYSIPMRGKTWTELKRSCVGDSGRSCQASFSVGVEYPDEVCNRSTTRSKVGHMVGTILFPTGIPFGDCSGCSYCRCQVRSGRGLDRGPALRRSGVAMLGFILCKYSSADQREDRHVESKVATCV